ncbi:hypothetical protein [Candidatus Methylomirabilis sp.]|uniref:Lipoprotein n=1 Tax=Candidatus Methylomirabilis tolerans TaxID=3123416 RepID=A0AAJ1AHG1_9BACT|nr:hypothetical protein [Candidatus Methylomirabilis sp.]
MKNIHNISIVILAATLIFGATACTEEKPKSVGSKKMSIEVDPILKEVNGLLAVLDVTVRLNKLTNCMLANSFSGLQGEGDKKSKQLSNNPILKEMVAEQEGLCKLFEIAENETRVTFDEIRNRKKLLNQQFVFSVFLSKEDDYDGAFVEEEIGVFSSLDSCAKVEKVAHDYSIPTRKCREWKDISGLFKSA